MLNKQEIKEKIALCVEELIEIDNRVVLCHTQKTSEGWKGNGVHHLDGDNGLQLKHIGTIIKAVVKRKKLDVKLSITTSHYSMGRSITVLIKNDTTVGNDGLKRIYNVGTDNPLLTDKGREVVVLIKHILAYFNYDSSDSMTDYYRVNYADRVAFS